MAWFGYVAPINDALRHIVVHHTECRSQILTEPYINLTVQKYKALKLPYTSSSQMSPTKQMEENTKNAKEVGLNMASYTLIKNNIKAATCWQDVIAALKHIGQEPIADRLVYLHDVVADDLDEKPIDLESLRQFALFIYRNQLPDPQIGTSVDGFVHAEWRIEDQGILAMVFLPSGSIEFVAMLKPSAPEERSWSVRSTQSPERMMDYIKPFTVKMAMP